MTDTFFFSSSISGWLLKVCEQRIWWWHTRCCSLWTCLGTGDVLRVRKKCETSVKWSQSPSWLSLGRRMVNFCPLKGTDVNERVERVEPCGENFTCSLYYITKDFSLWKTTFPVETVSNIVGQFSVSRQEKHKQSMFAWESLNKSSREWVIKTPTSIHNPHRYSAPIKPELWDDSDHS